MSKALVFALFLALPLATDAAGSTRCSSRPNIFGGQDIRCSDGYSASTRPNVFGGYDIRSRSPAATRSPGTPTGSRKNIFGGYDYPDGTSCKPNVFGGLDCRSPR